MDITAKHVLIANFLGKPVEEFTGDEKMTAADANMLMGMYARSIYPEPVKTNLTYAKVFAIGFSVGCFICIAIAVFIDKLV